MSGRTDINLTTPDGKRKVGYVEGRAYHTIRDQSHIVRKFNAWGFEVRLIDKLIDGMGVEWVVVHNHQEDEEYVVRAEDIRTLGIRKPLGGFEEQYFLPLRAWAVCGPRLGSVSGIIQGGER